MAAAVSTVSGDGDWASSAASSTTAAAASADDDEPRALGGLLLGVPLGEVFEKLKPLGSLVV